MSALGYCRLCRQWMESPYDCDCRCPHGEDARLSCPECDTYGHDWRDAGDLGRDEYEHITGMAECNNCGRVSSDPKKVTEVCPA